MRKITMMVGLGLALAVSPLQPVQALAEGLVLPRASSKTPSSQRRGQFALLDGRLAAQYENSTRLTPNGAKPMADSASLPRYAGRYKGEYLHLAKAAAATHGVPEDLFLRLVQQESGWNPGARSPKGATGLAQLMPQTAALLGVDPADPKQNLQGGARYLRMMYDRFGNWRLALAAYNAGPEAVARHGGVPPYAETKNYVRVIYGS